MEKDLSRLQQARTVLRKTLVHVDDEKSRFPGFEDSSNICTIQESIGELRLLIQTTQKRSI